MFCGVFLQSKPAGRRAKTGLCGWGILQGSGDCGGLPYLVVWDGDGLDFAKRWGVQSGSSLFTGMRWGGRNFAGRQVFPILWYKGAAACAYYSLKRR